MVSLRPGGSSTAASDVKLSDGTGLSQQPTDESAQGWPSSKEETLTTFNTAGDMAGNTAGDMTGKAMTVRGPVEPGRLGITIMHEHLFIDFRRGSAPDESTPATEWAFSDEPLTLEGLRRVGDRLPNADHRLLLDPRSATEEAMEFRYRGGDTIVDVTSIGLRRDPRALLRVSQSTGLNVVMGCGWYQKLYHPSNMDTRTVEDLAEEIVRDVTVGVGDTGIRSGIIGEVGVNGDPITPNEAKSVQASGRASRATGAAISLHRGGAGRERFDVIDLLTDEGADLSRVIFGHSDLVAGDVPLLLELLGHGVYIQFDILGLVGAPVCLQPPVEGFETLYVSALATLVTEAIPRIIEAGYADRILLSQDVCTKTQLKRYGGNGYSFILEKFLPRLREVGVEEANIRKMMVDNPRRVLTFAEPVG